MRSWMRKMMLACLAPATLATMARAEDPLPIAPGPNGIPIAAPNGAINYGVVPHSGMLPSNGAIVNGAPVNRAVVNSAPMNGMIVEDNGAAPVMPGGFTLTPTDSRFRVYGWLDGGYVYNTGNPGSNFNGPYNSVYRASEGMFNQAYLIAEYGLPKENCFGFGGRIDAIYGMDYLVAQSVGVELNPNGSPRWNSNDFYGVAIPQAYAIAGTNDTNVKVGHFYSIVGYEGVQAAGNFFYSKSYSYQFAGPFTHWGAIGSHNLSDQLQVQAGAVMGWNTLDATQDKVNGIAGLKYTGCDKNWWSSFAIVSGDEFNNVAGLPGIIPGNFNRTRYSFIVDLQPTDRIEYVFHQWLGFQTQGTEGGGTALWYGIDQYAYYKVNDCLKFGGRFEWFRDEDGTRVGLTLPNNPNRAPLPGSYYSATVGFNYSPIANLTIRPEARYDWVTDTGGARSAFGDGTNNCQFMLGIDAILKF